MNTLVTMYQGMAMALTHEPQLLLASTVAAFDPFWNVFDTDDIDYDTEPLYIALQMTRSVFPDIYAEAIEALRSGATSLDMDHLICKSISAKGIPLDDLETIGWGIPLVGVGVELDDPSFYAAFPEVLPILALFGIVLPDGEDYSLNLPEPIYRVGREIAASLYEHPDPVLRQVSWAIAWLFSCTGNSLVDCTDEMLSELHPLSWSSEDIELAIEMIKETNEIMRDVQAGLETLNTSGELRVAIERNVTKLYRQQVKKGKWDGRHIRLDWSSVSSGSERATLADAELL
jgi:hypothetical protein